MPQLSIVVHISLIFSKVKELRRGTTNITAVNTNIARQHVNMYEQCDKGQLLKLNWVDLHTKTNTEKLQSIHQHDKEQIQLAHYKIYIPDDNTSCIMLSSKPNMY